MGVGKSHAHLRISNAAVFDSLGELPVQPWGPPPHLPGQFSSVESQPQNPLKSLCKENSFLCPLWLQTSHNKHDHPLSTIPLHGEPFYEMSH